MFDEIKKKVVDQFDILSKGELFEVDLDRDILFNTYLSSLPEEERQSHNCNCCKHFIRNFGGVVSIVNNEVKTLREFKTKAPFADVPAALHAIVKAAPIKGVFISKEKLLGTDHNRQRSPETNEVITWKHFSYVLPKDKIETNLVF